MKKTLSMLLLLLITLTTLMAQAENLDVTLDNPEITEIEFSDAPAIEIDNSGLADLDLTGIEAPLVDDAMPEAVSEAQVYAGTEPQADAVKGDVTIDQAHFPDKVFRSIVSADYDTDGNGTLSAEEICQVTQIRVEGKGIASLEGVEVFTELLALSCNDNRLTSLDIRQNSKLQYLNCGKNQLTSLKANDCPYLHNITCYENQLTSLNVSNDSSLQYLISYGNPLTSLNMSGCTTFPRLEYNDKQLKHLNMSGCTALSELVCRNNRLTYLDVTGCTALNNLICLNNRLKSLNVSDCTALGNLNCSDNRLTSLNPGNCTALVSLYCEGNQLERLDVSRNTRLVTLHCHDNRLKRLDVSKNKALEEFYCNGNRLTSLNVSGKTALQYLNCSHNRLTSLKVSGCTALTDLNCGNNQLTRLNIRRTPLLWTIYCSNNKLTKLYLPKGSELYSVDCSNNRLSSLNVSEIESLRTLYCSHNQLKRLDVSKNTDLEFLYCQDNQLNRLDLSSMDPSVKESILNGNVTHKKGVVSMGCNAYTKQPFVTYDDTVKVTMDGETLWFLDGKSIKGAEIRVKDQEYTGKALTPPPTVKLNGVKLKQDTDYTVSYKNNVDIGTATLSIMGRGKYAGNITVKATFNINPKATVLSGLTAGKNMLTAQWEKQSNITGYQIQFSLKSNFKESELYYTPKANALSTTIWNLTSGETYYVRVRTYKMVGQIDYCSSWSKAKSAKVK